MTASPDHDSIRQSVDAFLHQHRLLPCRPHEQWVVAYSGGADSSVLLHVLSELRAEYGFELTAAYYWHPWRPLQADLAVVHQNTQAWNVPWVMLTPDLTLPHTEAAARSDRYNQLAGYAHYRSATAVFTGHHADDQLETVLFRILRGTGLEGLKGIPEQRPVSLGTMTNTVYRPLLSTTRTEIETYCQTHNIAFVTDPTNADVQHKRNWIRKVLVPTIQTEFPQVRDSVARLSQHADDDLTVVTAQINSLWQTLWDEADRSLNEQAFNQLARPFQLRIAQRLLQTFALETSATHIESVVNFITGVHREANHPGLLSLGNEQFLAVYRNRVRLEKRIQADILPVEIPKIPTAISHTALKATLEIIQLTPEQRTAPIDYEKLSPNEIYVDFSKLNGQPLYFRTRQEKDRIQPLGMSAPMRLKKLLMNRAIPRLQRSQIPVIATTEEVLWAVGVSMSERIKVTHRPTHKLILTPVETELK